jgi:hypothetical protein
MGETPMVERTRSEAVLSFFMRGGRIGRSLRWMQPPAILAAFPAL